MLEMEKCFNPDWEQKELKILCLRTGVKGSERAVARVVAESIKCQP
jgi:uncharacterized protein YneF (UPF0154 family)